MVISREVSAVGQCTGNNVYETGNGNVGIGTTFLTNAALAVMNGNVGIGTWAPTTLLQLYGGNFRDVTNGAGAFTLSNSSSNGTATSYFSTDSGTNLTLGASGAGTGIMTIQAGTNNIGIGTTTPVGGLTVMNGNVGIGTWVPGLILDVKGTIRTTNFTMSGQAPTAGYVLTASDSAGDTTWSISRRGQRLDSIWEQCL